MDDILVMGNNPVHIKALLAQLQSQFAVRDLGTLSYFLGIAATWTKEGLFLSQHKYVTDFLRRAQMTRAILLLLPFPQLQSFPLLVEFLSVILLCIVVVGALQYLTFTRPDIAYVVNKV